MIKNIIYRAKEFAIYILLLTILFTSCLSLWQLQNLPSQLFEVKNDSAYIIEATPNTENISKIVVENQELLILYPTDVDFGQSGISNVKLAPISVYFLPDKLFLDYFAKDTFGISSDLKLVKNLEISYTNLGLFDDKIIADQLKNIDKTYTNWQQKAAIKNTNLTLKYGGINDFAIKDEVLQGVYLPLSQKPNFGTILQVAGVRYERDLNLLTKREKFGKAMDNWHSNYDIFLKFVLIITVFLVAFVSLKIIENNSKTLKTLKLLGYKNLRYYKLAQILFAILTSLLISICIAWLISSQILQSFVLSQVQFLNLIIPK